MSSDWRVMSVKITTRIYHNNSCNYYTSTHGCPGHLLQGGPGGGISEEGALSVVLSAVRTTQLDILSSVIIRNQSSHNNISLLITSSSPPPQQSLSLSLNISGSIDREIPRILLVFRQTPGGMICL